MTPEDAIRRYARTGDAEAFAALVRQYQQLVYAAASRRLSRREDVEDAAQQAFLGLARSAANVPRDVAAWLYRAAQHAAVDVLRRNAARKKYESAVEPQVAADVPDAAEWREQSLAIDDAIAALPEADRSLVIEHFLAGRSQRELAAAFKTSQPTIQRRLESAVARLREHLAAHGGGMLGASALVSHLPAMGQATVPAATSAELAKIALALPAKPVAATAGGAKVAFGAKVAAGALLTTAAVVGVAILSRHDDGLPPVAPAATASPAAPSVPVASPAEIAAALARLSQVYRLPDDRDVALYAAPFPAERDAFANAAYPQWQALRFQSEFGFVAAEDGSLTLSSARAAANFRRLLDPIRDDLKLDWYEIDVRAIDRVTVRRPSADWAPAGDWLVRDGVSVERRVKGFARVLGEWLGRPVRFERSIERRPCLVVRGPLRPATRRIADVPTVAVTGEPNVAAQLDAFDLHDSWRADSRLQFHDVSQWLDAPLLQPDGDALRAVGQTRFVVGPDVRRRDDTAGYVQLDHVAPDYRDRLRGVAASMEAQLGGAWTVEDRDVERWTAVVGEGEAATP